MTDTRPPPMFLADSRGLDFLNTLAVPVDTEVEWLASGEDLLAGRQSAGLITADFSDVKQCEGPGCVLHFLDTTQDRRRR